MKIELKLLTLEHFKGIIKQRIEFSSNTHIYFENEGGKTTYYDAFLWCLFGKDSLDQADFDIKTRCTSRTQSHFPKNKIGDVIHKLDHSVELVLIIDDIEKIFKRTYRETYPKKRGTASRVFTGHETDYSVDGVPTGTKKEYDLVVSELIDEKLFRLLSDVMYFNSKKYGWEKRRKTLIELAPEVKEADIKGYNLIKSLLEGRTVENQQKVIKATRTEINKEIAKIPIQIEEAAGFIIEIEPITGDVEKLEKDKRILQQQMTDLKSDRGQATRRRNIADLQTKILEKRNEFNQEKSEKVQGIQKKIDELRADEQIFKTEQTGIKYEKESIEKSISEAKTERQSFRDKWTEVANRVENIEKTCPTCNQDIPEWSIKETLETLNIQKADLQKAYKTKGLEKTEMIATLEKRLNETVKTDDLEKSINDCEFKIAGLVKEKIEADQKTVDVKELEYKKQVLEDQPNEAPADTSELESQIQEIDSQIKLIKANVLNIQKNQEYRDRIKELEILEGKLSQEYAKLEGQLDKLDKFTVEKVYHIEDQINDMFGIARFKMFINQINEGVRETCKTMKDGVPYNSMNSAGRIQVGVDIANTLQKYHKVKCPIFVDNRESVTMIPDVDCQIVSLYVSPSDKEMRIENNA